MTMSNANNQRLLDERATADLNALRLPPERLERWNACRSGHRFMAHQGKQLVAYTLLFQSPQLIDTFTCRGLDVSLDSGLSSLWESQQTGESFWVSSVPKEVSPNCFLWMLKYSSLEFVEYKGQKSLRFSIGLRQALNPARQLVDGSSYLMEKAAFDHTTFPTK